MKRYQLVFAGIAVAVAACGGGGPTLDSAAALNSALPVQDDISGFTASGGIDEALSAPQGIQMGRVALTGGKLAAQCRTYTSQGTGWACDGLIGLGTVGFEDDQNVDSRVSSYVLAYDGADSAGTAWSKLVDATRTYLKGAKEGSGPAEGDQSRYFSSQVGTTAVVRVGSVVILEDSNYQYGYATGSGDTLPYGYAHPPDPIHRWADVQTRKVIAALGS